MRQYNRRAEYDTGRVRHESGAQAENLCDTCSYLGHRYMPYTCPHCGAIWCYDCGTEHCRNCGHAEEDILHNYRIQLSEETLSAHERVGEGCECSQSECRFETSPICDWLISNDYVPKY